MIWWRAPAAALALIGAATVAAWALAGSQNSLSGYAIRAVSDMAAVVALGLALVPRFDAPRYRAEFAATTTRPLIVCAVVWTVAELIRLVVVAAQTAGASVPNLDARTAVEFARSTASGHAGLVCLSAALAVGIAAALPRSAATEAATIGLAAVGITTRGLIGHFAQSPVGGFVVALHALSAAVWCGSLAALALTVRRRGRWARVLPRFSTVALVCVIVLLACGVIAAAMALPGPSALYLTGYGRLVVAKVVVSAVLTMLAWRNRARWLPVARGHRATSAVSRTRSRVELGLMAIALTFAAALVVTG